MKAWLVWVKQWYGKTELQVWFFDPAKMLRKPSNIAKIKEIPIEIAEELSLEKLEKVYGSQPAN